MALVQLAWLAVRRLPVYFLGDMGPAAESVLPELREALRKETGPSRLHVAEAAAKIAPRDDSGINAVAAVLHRSEERRGGKEVSALVSTSLSTIKPEGQDTE